MVVNRIFSDFDITPQTFNEAITQMLQWIANGQKRFISTCTVYTLMRAHETPLVFKSLQQADMRTADGMPLVWLLRKHGFKHAERVYGPDLMLAICAQTAHDPQISHFFLGSDNTTLAKLKGRLLDMFPTINIAGMCATITEDDIVTQRHTLIEQLNQSQATIIWAGLGSPKQDIWMAHYRPYLDASLLVGVGAAFTFISGQKPQAPRWMQHNGLEWLFRLLHEPCRLWKRYTVYNLRFLSFVIRTELL